MAQVRIILISVLAFLCFTNDSCLASSHWQVQRETSQQYSEKTLIIFYQGKSGKARLLRAVKRYKAKVIYNYNNFNSIAISIPDGKTLEQSIRYFKKVKGVIAVNKDYINKLDTAE